ncbi:MAG: dipeptidase [Chitinophagaceae bacterium]
MRHFLLAILLLAFTFIQAQSVKKLHSKAVLVDTHNDVLSSAVLDGIDISNRVKQGHSDLVRWKEGRVDVQFFSVWTDKKARTKEGFFHDAVAEIDSLNRLLLRNPHRMIPATHYKEVKKGIRQQKLVSLIGVEGGHMIEDKISNLEELARLGMRYMTLTWNNSTSWATSAMDENSPSFGGGRGEVNSKGGGRGEAGGGEKKRGLSEFGKQVVKRMNELGVMVDLSHTGEKTFYDAIAASSKPVLVSHSSVWNLCPVFRNVKDDQIKAVAKNGGVICINFYSGFISRKWDETQKELNDPNAKTKFSEQGNYQADTVARDKEWRKYRNERLDAVRPTLADLVNHIDYIVKLVGDDYVGIGSDYDGVGSVPIGMEDVTTYPKITEELKRRGYSDKSVKKILGKNVLRVMKANFN